MLTGVLLTSFLLVAGPLAAVLVVLAVLAEPAAAVRDEDSSADAPEELLREAEQAFVVLLLPSGDEGLDLWLLRPDKIDHLEILRRPAEEHLVGVAVGRKLEVVGQVSERPALERRLELADHVIFLDEVDDAPERDAKHLACLGIHERDLKEELRVLHAACGQPVVLGEELLPFEDELLGIIAIGESNILIEALRVPVGPERPKQLVERRIPARLALLVEPLERLVDRAPEDHAPPAGEPGQAGPLLAAGLERAGEVEVEVGDAHCLRQLHRQPPSGRRSAPR